MKESLIQPAVIVITAASAMGMIVSLFKGILRYQIWQDNIPLLCFWIGVFLVSSGLLFFTIRKPKGWIWRAFEGNR